MLEIGRRYSHDWLTLVKGEPRTTEFDVLQLCGDAYFVHYDNKDLEKAGNRIIGETGFVSRRSRRDLESTLVR